MYECFTLEAFKMTSLFCLCLIVLKFVFTQKFYFLEFKVKTEDEHLKFSSVNFLMHLCLAMTFF